MFEYKDKEFYTDYFNNQDDFELVQKFELSNDKDESDLYVGMIKAKECIHPLTIRVEIPTTFPHNNLTFRTRSLSGYPHLIHTGKIQYGDWFCLNTPFGETAENQLDLELYRLREWIKRQIRPELPANIKDPKFANALLRANAYEWENVDELNELRKDAVLTFIGNQEISKEKRTGYFHCITKNNHFYVVRNKEVANYKLPYIIVDRSPSESQVLQDVIALEKYYGWDNDAMQHVLPEINLKYEWQPFGTKRIESFDEKAALRLLDNVLASLEEDNCRFKVDFCNRIILRQLDDKEKSILKKEISEDHIKEIKANHGFVASFMDDDIEEAVKAEEEWETAQDSVHSFALGIRQSEKNIWYLCQTRRVDIKYEDEYIDIGICWQKLHRPYACGLNLSLSQTIEEKEFFGRGMFSDSLRNRKIAIVGLGAIGSMLAESLARSGVTAIGLWDNDLVEPGNICRSTFRIQDTGENKARTIKKHLAEINPFVSIEEIKASGDYYTVNNHRMYMGGDFYSNINYDSQETVLSKIADYDLIIDCTSSNELLHFISYAISDKDIVSLCITNHAKDLLMFSNCDGNPFELRKAYLSKIEQDTKNFYLENTGCYSTTFLATNSSIATLVNMAVSRLNEGIASNNLHSVILSYDKRGIVADQLTHYKLKGHDITLTIGSETMMDGEDIPEAENGILGFVLGSYSADGRQIMITHIISAEYAKEQLEYAFQTSKGIIDYIGDFVYSGAESGTFSEDALYTIENKALNPNVNTNNPILAVRNPEGTLSFFLFLNQELIPFESTHS